MLLVSKLVPTGVRLAESCPVDSGDSVTGESWSSRESSLQMSLTTLVPAWKHQFSGWTLQELMVNCEILDFSSAGSTLNMV